MNPESFLQKTFGVHYIYKEKEEKILCCND